MAKSFGLPAAKQKPPNSTKPNSARQLKPRSVGEMKAQANCTLSIWMQLSAFGNNHDVIAEVAKNVKLPIQVGGGIRSYETAEKLFQTGITQVILGALAFSDPSAIGKIQKKFGLDSVIVALDNKDGQIMVEGWKTATAMTVDEALEKYTSHGRPAFPDNFHRPRRHA